VADDVTQGEGDKGHGYPYVGAAQSFTDAETFLDQEERREAIAEQMTIFDQLVSNIRFDPDLSVEEQAEKIGALTAELPGRIRGAKEYDATRPSFLARIGEKVKRLVEPAPVPLLPREPGTFKVFKDSSGQWSWMTIHSNTLWDREDERFSEEAHREYVSWVDENVKARGPELRVWHIPGTRLGKADVVAYDEGFMLAAGKFDKGQEGAAERLVALGAKERLGCSHGYWHAPVNEGVYERYRTFEISVLPLNKAANEHTGFLASQEVPMIDEAKRAMLAEVLGSEDAVSVVETGLASMRADAESKGLSFKELEEHWLTSIGVKDDEPGQAPEGQAAPPPEGEPAPDPMAAMAAATDAAAAAGQEPAPEGDKAGAPSEMVQLIAAVTKLGEVVAAQGEDIKALKASDDSKVAASFRPKFDPTQNGFLASNHPDTVVDGPAAKDAVNQHGDSANVPDALRQYFGADGKVRTGPSQG
jgi:hypothetical protein